MTFFEGFFYAFPESGAQLPIVVRERVEPTNRPFPRERQPREKQPTPAQEGRRSPDSVRQGLFSSYIPRELAPQEEQHLTKQLLPATLVRPASLLEPALVP